MNDDAPHLYVGLWVTADGRVRHALLADGRYDEARNGRAHAYQGRYRITGHHIDYVDDTGFTADGDFVEPDVLHHAGMILTRVAPTLRDSCLPAKEAPPDPNPNTTNPRR